MSATSDETLSHHEGTKGTKDSDIFDYKLRDLRVLRGKDVFSVFVAAPPRYVIATYTETTNFPEAEARNPANVA